MRMRIDNGLKFISKGINLVETLLWTFYGHMKYRAGWKFGKRIIFEGNVRSNSLKGDVIIGSAVRIGPNVRIDCGKGAVIKIGNDVTINQGTFLICNKKLTIGNETRIGEYCSIRDNDHNFENIEVPIYKQGFKTKETIIGKDVWIGRGVTILKGIVVGNGVIIGAGSVVTKNIPDYDIVVGNPIRKIGNRNING